MMKTGRHQALAQLMQRSRIDLRQGNNISISGKQ
ncbi:MAG TPA: hypothetical protein DEB17_10140 [Chlorobaculum sp.]|uniref:Uncharacterized protein n=1 Tax=Chlorobaculum tepidum (strain ATCC 49652 / DSM 12025 / NBRC 103806 / TLS) TaxID=194439 RepID=Q8KG99_CHLTE|nr:hypothetical protein CT0069 [Chlorobaculum tepidum TLS]HBU24327.1 hypothetical protein [Chlorobaculum sp.]